MLASTSTWNVHQHVMYEEACDLVAVNKAWLSCGQLLVNFAQSSKPVQQTICYGHCWFKAESTSTSVRPGRSTYVQYAVRGSGRASTQWQYAAAAAVAAAAKLLQVLLAFQAFRMFINVSYYFN
jgi:hypothetical protein